MSLDRQALIQVQKEFLDSIITTALDISEKAQVTQRDIEKEIYQQTLNLIQEFLKNNRAILPEQTWKNFKTRIEITINRLAFEAQFILAPIQAAFDVAYTQPFVKLFSPASDSQSFINGSKVFSSFTKNKKNVIDSEQQIREKINTLFTLSNAHSSDFYDGSLLKEDKINIYLENFRKNLSQYNDVSCAELNHLKLIEKVLAAKKEEVLQQKINTWLPPDTKIVDLMQVNPGNESNKNENSFKNLFEIVKNGIYEKNQTQINNIGLNHFNKKLSATFFNLACEQQKEIFNLKNAWTQEKVAKFFIEGMVDQIINIEKWDLGFISTRKIRIENKDKEVPRHVANIYAEYIAAEKDRKWVDHYNKIAEMIKNVNAHSKCSFLWLNKRSETTQTFYRQFKNLTPMMVSSPKNSNNPR